jgi:protein-S-isoprenylcysteine O-methyltransferase Ste14
MYPFLVPLIIGFADNLASAFTGVYSKKWGERKGTLVTILLRDIFGIPVWGLGFALAAVNPSVQLFRPAIGLSILGWAGIAAGALIILIALSTIRSRAAAPTTRDSLAETGIYAHMRHPIHAGTLLEFLGIVLIRPSLSLAIACGSGIVWVILQTLCEEWDLLRRIPVYRDYMKRVPRFIPRMKRH